MCGDDNVVYVSELPLLYEMKRGTHKLCAETAWVPMTLPSRSTPMTLSETTEGPGNGLCTPKTNFCPILRTNILHIRCNEVGFLQEGAPLNHPTLVTRLVQPAYDEVYSPRS